MTRTSRPVSGLRSGSYTTMHINAPNVPKDYTPYLDYALSLVGPHVNG